MPSEEDELLAQFDRTDSEVRAALVADDGEEYKAFNVENRRQVSLYIRPVGEPYQFVSYRYLLHQVAEPRGTRLDLVFSFMLVSITGRNLLELAVAISKERVGFIQQFDGKQWHRPKDGSAAFIESIKYLQSMPPPDG